MNEISQLVSKTMNFTKNLDVLIDLTICHNFFFFDIFKEWWDLLICDCIIKQIIFHFNVNYGHVQFYDFLYIGLFGSWIHMVTCKVNTTISKKHINVEKKEKTNQPRRLVNSVQYMLLIFDWLDNKFAIIEHIKLIIFCRDIQTASRDASTQV